MATKQSTNQLGVCSWSLKPTSPEDLIAQLDKLELKKLQLAISPIRVLDGWEDAIPQLRDAGYDIVSGMFGTIGENYSTLETIRKTGGFVPDEHWDENFKIARDTATICQAAGLTLVSTHAGFLPHKSEDAAGFSKLVDRLTQVAKMFADHGLVLLFETGQETAETLTEVLDELDANGASNTGVNFDPANMILYAKGDPVDALAKLASRTSQVHIKDAKETDTPGTWGSEVPIGEGDVDWPNFIRVLEKADYKGDMIIEREAGDDRAGDIRIAEKHIGQVIEDVAKGG